jgi:hypothetical protein
MLKHALRGHDLSKVHFYQDGSGDTYYEPVLDKRYDETMAESAARLSYRCKTAEEGLASFKKWKEEAVKEIKK